MRAAFGGRGAVLYTPGRSRSRVSSSDRRAYRDSAFRERWPRRRECVAAGHPIASDGSESTNKRLVGSRCKQGGKLWSKAGRANMRALRTAFMNPGPWGHLWSRADEIRQAAGNPGTQLGR